MHDVANAKAIGRWIGLAYLLALVFSTTGDTIMSGMFDGGPASEAVRRGPQFARFAASLGAAVTGAVAWLATSALVVRLTQAVRPIAGRILLLCALGGVLIDLYAQSELMLLMMSGAAGRAIDWFGAYAQHYQQATMASQGVYGLWLIPFGWLLARTHIAPRTIGICLIAGGLGYLLLFATMVVHGLGERGTFQVLRLACGIAAIAGELGSCLWLLVFGARDPNVAPA